MERAITASPDQLLERIDFNAHANPLWNVCLRQKLTSPTASKGIWMTDHVTDIQSVSHIDTSKLGRARMSLFSRNPSEAETRETALELATTAVKHVFMNQSETTDNSPPTAIVTFGAVDRRIRETLKSAFEEKYKIEAPWDNPCGMWMLESGLDHDPGANNAKVDLPGNVILRSLRADDAEFINSRWEYRSEDSICMVHDMIAVAESTYGGCIGMEIDGQLVAWVCRYLDGTLGMLWTEEKHRRKGYGIHALTAAVKSLRERHEERTKKSNVGNRKNTMPPLIAFTVDGNNSSKGLLSKIGWKRVADADWTGFKLARQSSSDLQT